MTSVVDDPGRDGAEDRDAVSAGGLRFRPWSVAAGLGSAFLAGFVSLGAAIGPEILHLGLNWKSLAVAGTAVAVAAIVIYQIVQDQAARASLREAEVTLQRVREERRPSDFREAASVERGVGLTQEELDSIALEALDTGRLEVIVLKEFGQEIGDPTVRTEIRNTLVRLGRVHSAAIERLGASRVMSVGEAASGQSTEGDAR